MNTFKDRLAKKQRTPEELALYFYASGLDRALEIFENEFSHSPALIHKAANKVRELVGGLRTVPPSLWKDAVEKARNAPDTSPVA